MVDCFGRKIDYMRVSVTDRCDLRCKYCMPGGIEKAAEILSFEDIAEICAAAAGLGIKYIRLTGGEPLARKGIEDLVSMLRGIDKIERITMTTNGVQLKKKLDSLMAAGLDGINISLDTLDREKYQRITGFDRLNDVLDSIDAAYGKLAVKINAVVLEENIDECLDLIEMAKGRSIDVRFIEMMPIGEGKKYRSIGCQEVLNKIREAYPKIYAINKTAGAGPAAYWHIPGFKGEIGFISAVHESFCSQCNRIRLTSTGFLKGCLCYDTGADLKPALGSDRLTELIETVIKSKPERHCFDKTDNITEHRAMRQIGG